MAKIVKILDMPALYMKQHINAQKNADEASENLESARREYLPLIRCFTQVYIITESFKKVDPIYYFDTDSDYFDILSKCWKDSRERNSSLGMLIFNVKTFFELNPI